MHNVVYYTRVQQSLLEQSAAAAALLGVVWGIHSVVLSVDKVAECVSLPGAVGLSHWDNSNLVTLDAGRGRERRGRGRRGRREGGCEK